MAEVKRGLPTCPFCGNDIAINMDRSGADIFCLSVGKPLCHLSSEEVLEHFPKEWLDKIPSGGCGVNREG